MISKHTTIHQPENKTHKDLARDTDIKHLNVRHEQCALIHINKQHASENMKGTIINNKWF